MNKYLAELAGTFVLVFCGTGAIVVSNECNGIITHTQIAIIFGLSVMTMILMFRKISGAHINPAVTIALALAKKFKWKNVLPYMVFQIAGAMAASFLVMTIFPNNKLLGATLPSISVVECFVIELVLTFILMIGVLRAPGRYSGMIIGVIVGLEAYFAGKFTGASMNPSRSLAPALVSGHTEFLWIYLTAPVMGASLAVYANKLIR